MRHRIKAIINGLGRFAHALVSDRVWQALYDARRRTGPERGTRSKSTILLLSGVFLAIIAMIVTAYGVQRDDHAYLRDRSGVVVIDDKDLLWRHTEFLSVDKCASIADCRKTLREASWSSPALWSNVYQKKNPHDNDAYILLSTTVPKKYFFQVVSSGAAMLVLPRMRFARADIFINGKFEGGFVKSIPWAIPVEEISALDKDLEVEVLLRRSPSPSGIGLINAPAFVATVDAYDAYWNHVSLVVIGQGADIAVVARITLAIFAILLFLLIDASPESLGLALLLGFDAVNLSARNGWLPIPWLGGWGDIAIYNFCLFMSYVCRGYFYTQLARVTNKNAAPWLLVGSILASLFVVVALFEANKPGAQLVFYISQSTRMLVNFAGVVLCARAIWSIRSSWLPWRLSALTFAIMGSVTHVFFTFDGIFFDYEFFSADISNIIEMFHFNSPYLLSLSAFVNISSLENRVRSLTEVKVRAQKIEDELEIARGVQQSLLRLPQLPPAIDFSFHQEAASFVSGDTFYAHWDEGSQVFTFLLNDVTGHGMQAALKATICNVMADVLWSKGMDRRDPRHQRSKLAAYHRLIREYMREQTGQEDVHSILGAEFYATTGRLLVYRANAPMPILIRPDGESFCAEVQSLKNTSIVSLDLQPGSALVFASDGIFSSSRDTAKILRGLNAQLMVDGFAEDRTLSSRKIESVVMKICAEQLSPNHDDRTILVFRWRDVGAEAKNLLRDVS